MCRALSDIDNVQYLYIDNLLPDIIIDVVPTSMVYSSKR